MILYLKYLAEVWVAVDTDVEDVVEVMVDEASMVHPHDAVVSGGEQVSAAARQDAERIAGGIDWPSWDYRPNPV